MIEDTGTPPAQKRNVWKILGWILLGCLIGLLMAAGFVAYGQPGLLLEQMNLRYCG
jgi:hypothetical protein